MPEPESASSSRSSWTVSRHRRRNCGAAKRKSTIQVDQMIKIDLDGGVKVNYAKFQDVLAKIK